MMISRREESEMVNTTAQMFSKIVFTISRAAYQQASQYLCDFNSPHFLRKIPRHLTTNLFYQFETFNFQRPSLLMISQLWKTCPHSILENIHSIILMKFPHKCFLTKEAKIHGWFFSVFVRIAATHDIRNEDSK